MIGQKSAARRLPLVVLAALLVGALLTGCIRSVLKTADAVAVLAGNRITATTSTDIGGAIGAVNGIDEPVSGISELNPEDVAEALIDTQGGRAKLLQLPTTPLPAGAAPAMVTPGFYQINGALVLADGQSLTLSGNGVYVFNITGDLLVGTAAQLILADGALPANIFWNVNQATLGAGSSFSGTILATGDIAAGNTLLLGKLLSLTGSVEVGGAQIIDANFSSEVFPRLSLPAAEYTVVPGQPVQFTVQANATEAAPIAISVLGLPTGATHTPNLNGVDTDGANGSDVLVVDVASSEQTIGSTFSWVPTIPGTYRLVYLARAPGGISGNSGPVAAAEGKLDGAIDLCPVTITVLPPASTRGTAYGSGGFSGTGTGTFQFAVVARRDGLNAAGGSLSFRIPAAGLQGRSTAITTLAITDLGGGRKSAFIIGTVRVPRLGTVPFLANVLDAGRTAGERDQFQLTLLVDTNGDTIPEQITYGGVVTRGGSISIP